jgi:hypothetical protein
MKKGGRNMAVITISRQTESLGTKIAQEMADKLHYEYLDKGESNISIYGQRHVNPSGLFPEHNNSPDPWEK